MGKLRWVKCSDIGTGEYMYCGYCTLVRYFSRHKNQIADFVGLLWFKGALILEFYQNGTGGET